MQENNKKQMVIIIIIFTVLFTALLGVKKYFRNKIANEPLPEVKLKEINDVKSFAIMIQNENGYEEYNKDTWPTEGYKFKEAKCIDNNGSKVDNAITYNNGKVTLETDKTVYCTLYFDIKNTINALDIVASKPKSLSPNPDQGDMYRYQGTSELVNDNYICFGTKEKSECTNDENHYMYRIIGITPEGEMKLIKETPIVEEGNTIFSWYKATGITEEGTTLYGTAEKGFETWPESMLYKRLNGLSNGIITGDGQNATTSTNKNINANTDIFVDSSEYEYLKSGDENGTNDGIGSDWYKKIADHDWMYGDTEDSFNFNGHEMYKAETGQIPTKYNYFNIENGVYESGIYIWNTETDKVTAKICLPYLYDFYLAYYDGETEETRGNSGVSSLGENWLLNIGPSDVRGKAIMERCTNIVSIVFPHGWVGMRVVGFSGEGPICNVGSVRPYGVGFQSHPTFYLPNTIEMEGTGIETDPYRIVN